MASPHLHEHVNRTLRNIRGDTVEMDKLSTNARPSKLDFEAIGDINDKPKPLKRDKFETCEALMSGLNADDIANI